MTSRLIPWVSRTLFLGLLCSAATAHAAGISLPDGGTITIDFSQSGTDAVRYRYTPPSGSSIAIDDEFAEGRGGNKSKFTYPAGSSLLSFSTGDNCSDVGFTNNKDWIGCYKKGGIGTGKIANGQSLIVALDPTGPAANSLVTDWTWGFTAKQNVVAEIELSDADGSNPRTLTLYTGTEGIAAVARGLGPDEFACSLAPDSSPDSEADCSISGSQPWQAAEIRVINDGQLSIGSADSSFQLSAFTGKLTCEEDDPELTTTVEEIFDAGGGVQCRRLPNRDGTACEAVPYLLTSTCDLTGTCELDFVHGDQPTIDVERDQYAFLCEVWWPERPGSLLSNPDGQPTQPVLPKTDIFWGGDDINPPVLGDVPVDYCVGTTPIFSAPQLLEPNQFTNCGTSLAYRLSEPAVPGPIVNGGTVAPDSTDCSLLEAYDDVLLPASFPDQCDADADCPLGRQIACLVDSRISQVEDTEADCTGTAESCPGSDPGDVNTATSIYRNYELILIQGDLRMRRN